MCVFYLSTPDFQRKDQVVQQVLVLFSFLSFKANFLLIPKQHGVPCLAHCFNGDSDLTF